MPGMTILKIFLNLDSYVKKKNCLFERERERISSRLHSERGAQRGLNPRTLES